MMIRVASYILLTGIFSSTVMAGGSNGVDNLGNRLLKNSVSKDATFKIEAEELESSNLKTRSFSLSTILAATDDANICVVPPATEPGTVLSATGPSLVLNNPTALQANFSFSKTINQIVNTSGATNTTGAIDMVESMMSTYTETVSSKVNSGSGVNMTLDARPGEAALQASDLLSGLMQPTALFNRLDLAPTDGRHCGEYRIIYNKQSSSNTDRFFIIFEAQYPNPTPAAGLAGCLPIADFWVSLNSMNDADAAVALEKFFYQGIEHGGVSLPAVVNFRNYHAGQVRTNNFVNAQLSGFVWQLREFKTLLNNGSAEFDMVTVKSNPLVELYGDNTGSLPAGNNTSKVSALFTGFKDDFTTEYLNQLINPELNGIQDNATVLINSIGLNPDNKYNEFQSTAGSTDEPLNNDSAVFNSAIATELSNHENTDVQVITAEMLLNRAGAMTCGGCHQFSRGKVIAPGIAWPQPAGAFVHVTESGELSPALINEFLPFRAAILTDIACNRPEPSPAWLVPILGFILN